jgi:hypothetical protein
LERIIVRQLVEKRAAKIRGLDGERDVSAVAFVAPWLVVGADEGSNLTVLRLMDESDDYEVAGTIPLLPDSAREIDIEGIARDGDKLYVTGSHSLVRQRLRKSSTYQENRKRLATVEPAPDTQNIRDTIFRFTFDASTGQMTGLSDRINIKDILRADAVLGRFTNIPSKENGVDIEGITVIDEMVYVGFRGPVLRSNFVPIMTFPFSAPTEYGLYFVDLGGLGIRDVNRVGDGFLLLTGPVGDGPGDYELYYWNGRDGIPGEDRDHTHVTRLGTVPAKRKAKAEGFTVIGESKKSYDVLVVYDGVPNGGLRRFKVPKI